MSVVGVILSGGLSTRYSGAESRTKALAEIAGAPLILHVAAGLARSAHRIIVLTGDNHEEIIDALKLSSADRSFADLRVSWRSGGATRHRLEFRRTPSKCGSAGRLLHLQLDDLGPQNLLAYTDILCDADLPALLRLIEDEYAIISMTAVNPVSPWGEILFDGERVAGFAEKALHRDRWINGGLFAFTPALIDQIKSRDDMLEADILPRLVAADAVKAHRHSGFWRSVETFKDRASIEMSDDAPSRPWAAYEELSIEPSAA